MHCSVIRATENPEINQEFKTIFEESFVFQPARYRGRDVGVAGRIQPLTYRKSKTNKIELEFAEHNSPFEENINHPVRRRERAYPYEN